MELSRKMGVEFFDSQLLGEMFYKYHTFANPTYKVFTTHLNPVIYLHKENKSDDLKITTGYINSDFKFLNSCIGVFYTKLLDIDLVSFQGKYSKKYRVFCQFEIRSLEFKHIKIIPFEFEIDDSKAGEGMIGIVISRIFNILNLYIQSEKKLDDLQRIVIPELCGRKKNYSEEKKIYGRDRKIIYEFFETIKYSSYDEIINRPGRDDGSKTITIIRNVSKNPYLINLFLKSVTNQYSFPKPEIFENQISYTQYGYSKSIPEKEFRISIMLDMTANFNEIECLFGEMMI
tara:strand:+ start:68 stop:931 length:864 start_codon:yes stop_codon:yes gene_type:complete